MGGSKLDITEFEKNIPNYGKAKKGISKICNGN